ncbi:carbohydrate-binding module family 1 protein [Cucurbitaria berberidis CBS 394.84]|uniref:AA9 family lytic polysaccharide monooxygenase n=1 Tax=Cucurbitaria berberidis CBS 394.84 TaxID=1168544 RepID=A0A9P4GVT6_9PLEO|nr:carbohydrate-binding module family 1 protein [Cucurbitaria berberidis CBS 394.84]KAF1852204.1 carbohydrate-binding module family 1 protein [Cucurbitaria berberidis CBS 394.84]
MFSKALLTTVLISAVSAHQNWHQLWINDVTPGYQTGIRMPPSNSPVTDVTSNDIVCNVKNPNAGAVATVAAKEGDKIKVQWDQSGHPGPITHFLFGPVDDAATATGVGAGWIKIDELDNVGGKWANEIMGANNMTHEFKLPTGLASGEYLLRSEMLALHGAQTLGGGQFYMGCAQLKITGTGSKGGCTPTISLPGAYKASDPNIFIPNVYNGFDASKYTAPGGPVAVCGGAGGAAPSVPSASAAPAPGNSTVPIETPASSIVAPISTAAPTEAAPAESEAPVESSSVIVAKTSSVASVLPTLAPYPTNNATVPVTKPVRTTLATHVRPRPTYVGGAVTSEGAATPTGGSGAVKLYYQCGGNNWKGATTCVTGAKCVKQNEFYSQCL